MDLSKFKKIGKQVTLPQKRSAAVARPKEPDPVPQKIVQLCPDNRSKAISQGKDAEIGDKVEIFDRKGVCVGYRIVKEKKSRKSKSTNNVTGKADKNLMTSTKAVPKRRGRPKKTVSPSPIPPGGSENCLENFQNDQADSDPFSTELPPAEKITVKRIATPKGLEGLHRTAAYTIDHRKAVLTSLINLIENDQIIHSTSSNIDEHFLKKWYHNCNSVLAAKSDKMDFELFVSYTDKIHKRSKSFAFSSIKPGSILNFWLDLANEIGQDLGYQQSHVLIEKILQQYKSEAGKIAQKYTTVASAAASSSSNDNVNFGADAKVADIDWEKLYSYLQALALPEDLYDPEKLPKLNQQEASLVVSIYHRRDQQTFKFLRSKEQASASNLTADLCQRALYLNKGYMAYKYSSMFQARPELLASTQEKNVQRAVSTAVSANKFGANERLPPCKKEVYAGGFRYFMHDTSKSLSNVNKSFENGNISNSNNSSSSKNSESSSSNKFSKVQKQKIEHHWWPSNIFSINVNVWNKDMQMYLPDDHGMDED